MSPIPAAVTLERTVLRDSHYLDADAAGTRAVEFRHEDALPLSEHRLTRTDLKCDAVAEQHCAKVRIRVHPIAVGMLRVVVHPLRVAIDDLLEDPHDVGVERLL